MASGGEKEGFSLSRLTAREITYSNFEISLVVFVPNITTNHAITYTNNREVNISRNNSEICITFISPG